MSCSMTSQSELTFGAGEPVRKKRRPALACLPCRKKKIKCDRQTPCLSCTKANESCVYVYDSRRTPTSAPFDASDIQFSVFEQTPRRSSISLTTTTLGQHDPSAIDENTDDVLEGSSPPKPPKDTSSFQGLSGRSYPHAELGHAVIEPLTPLDSTLAMAPSPLPITSSLQSGTFYQGKYYGKSHWMNFAYLSQKVQTAIQSCEGGSASTNMPAHITLTKCKAMSRNIKEKEGGLVRTYLQFGSSTRDLIPDSLVSTKLVQAYIRTFQMIFPILPTSSFREDYKAFWSDPTWSKETFDITLLLVLSIGSVFCPNEPGVTPAVTAGWTSYIVSWLSNPRIKTSLDLDILRILCLFLLLRQVRWLSCDVPWLSSDSLVRMAMQMGLHIDPGSQPIPASEAEMRRRMWALILELEVQSCMDNGNIPCVTEEDYDCLPPSNVDDTDTLDDPIVKPICHLTQVSCQILLTMSLPIRLKIARFVNNYRANHSFERALGLSSELMPVLERCLALLGDYRISSRPPTWLQTRVFDLLVRRFLLSLHHPFTTGTISDPQYHYSHRVCLDVSIALLSETSQSVNDDFHRLLLSGSDLYHNTYTQAALYLTGALSSACQLQDDWLFTAAVRSEMRETVSKYLEIALARLTASEESVETYVLVSCALAQVEAKQIRVSEDAYIFEALQKALGVCYSLLKAEDQTFDNVDWDIMDLGTTLARVDEPLEFLQWDEAVA